MKHVMIAIELRKFRFANNNNRAEQGRALFRLWNATRIAQVNKSNKHDEAGQEVRMRPSVY